MDKKEKVTRVFQMSADIAQMFFMITMWNTDHGVKDSPKLRQYILNWLAKINKMDRVYDTSRSEDQIIQDLLGKGFNLLDGRKNQGETGV